MYSKSYITYFMKYDNPGTQISFEREGLIKFNTIGLNTNIDNKVYKFFSLHYGLNLTYITKNQFDVDSVARRVSWNDNNGSSNLKNKLNVGINLGFGLKFSRNWSFEFNYLMGFTDYIRLEIENPLGGIFPQKLRGIGLTMSYKIYKKQKG